LRRRQSLHPLHQYRLCLTRQPARDFNEAIKLDPKYALAFYNRGLAKQRKGDSAGGRADIAVAKKIDPNVDK
jgi:hypothetical protein